MATLRQQARVVTANLPAGLRQFAVQGVQLVPDVQLPAFAPTLSPGGSFRLTIPSITGRAATTLTVPTPIDAIRNIEGVLPAGFPRLTQVLGIPGGEVVTGDMAPAAKRELDRPATRFRATQRTSTARNGRVLAGGYRTT